MRTLLKSRKRIGWQAEAPAPHVGQTRSSVTLAISAIFLWLLTLLVCGTLYAQIPPQDARNTEIPNTDTHFTARTYRTLAEWQAWSGRLRKQILSAAGLLPMPPKNP